MGARVTCERDVVRPVSRPSDRAEREADRAADVVARGGVVTGWSFSSVPLTDSSPVQREEAGNPSSDDQKKKQALEKTGEALAETAPAQKLKERVLDDPLVRKVKAAATSPAGIAVGATLAAGGVGVLAATGKELPFQPPTIPLDVITPGLSAKVTYRGPVNRPTEVGLTITFSPEGPKKSGASDSERFRAETARLKAEQDKFRAGMAASPGSKAAEDERLTQEAVKYVLSKQGTFGGVYLPLTAPPQKKTDDAAPAQRKATGESAAPEAVPDVPSGGRPLDPRLRSTMERRFGYDFSAVRLHDGASAATAAAAIDAAAYTIGTDVVFGSGRFSPNTPDGQHLLAHELTHVVQQRSSGAQPVIQRRGAGEWLGILFGTSEGSFDARELAAYLAKITADGKIEGSFDSDNKARALVRSWVASPTGTPLTALQKVLLIGEMIDGPTLGEDEACILDLLQHSDDADLRTMLGPGGVALDELESNIDGGNRTTLDRFVASRFQGGAAAVRAGSVVPIPAAAGATAAQVDDEGPVPSSGPATPTLLESLPGKERTRLQAVTTQQVPVDDLADSFDTTVAKTTKALPADTAVVLGAGLAGSKVAHGLRNVAATLSTGAKPPLAPNTTVTVELDLKPWGGSTGVYQLTFVAPPIPKGIKKKDEPGRRILVDFLGAARSPKGTKVPSGPDPVAEKMARHGLAHSFGQADLPALRSAIAQVPDAHLTLVRGLRFTRRSKPEKADADEAGHYDPETHTVVMFDGAFAATAERFAGGGVVTTGPARAIVHEIGHAVDLQPLRAAWRDVQAADKGMRDLATELPDPDNPGGYRWTSPAEKAKVDDRVKARREATAALAKVRSRSGSRTVPTKDGGFTDVIDKAASTSYRSAAKKDGSKAVSSYGDTDWQEHFAEAYSLFVTAPAVLRSLRPNTFAWFEQNL